MNNTNITTDTDTMPRETAVALLTNPKEKLTSRMRKTCRAALQKVWTSWVPFEAGDPGQDSYYPRPDKSRTPAAKLADKFRAYPIDRLHRLLNRTTKKQRGIAHAIENVSSPKAEARLKDLFDRLAFVNNLVIREIELRQEVIAGIQRLNAVLTDEIKQAA